jgi:hypothetical protein
LESPDLFETEKVGGKRQEPPKEPYTPAGGKRKEPFTSGAFPPGMLPEFAHLTGGSPPDPTPVHWTPYQLLLPLDQRALPDGMSMHPAALRWKDGEIARPARNTTDCEIKPGAFWSNDVSCARDAFRLAIGKVRILAVSLPCTQCHCCHQSIT